MNTYRIPDSVQECFKQLKFLYPELTTNEALNLAVNIESGYIIAHKLGIIESAIHQLPINDLSESISKELRLLTDTISDIAREDQIYQLRKDIEECFDSLIEYLRIGLVIPNKDTPHIYPTALEKIAMVLEEIKSSQIHSDSSANLESIANELRELKEHFCKS